MNYFPTSGAVGRTGSKAGGVVVLLMAAIGIVAGAIWLQRQNPIGEQVVVQAAESQQASQAANEERQKAPQGPALEIQLQHAVAAVEDVMQHAKAAQERIRQVKPTLDAMALPGSRRRLDVADTSCMSAIQAATVAREELESALQRIHERK